MKSVTELPFNRLIGLERREDASAPLRLPSGEQYLNHLGTVHASAQLALAEAASGEFLLRVLADASNVLPVVRRLEAKFRKPASGELVASVTTTTAEIEQLQEQLAGKSRALIEITVNLHDASGAHTLTAVVEWFLQTLQT